LPLIPLSLYHFQTFSMGGILLNPVAMPLASHAIVCGFASLSFGLSNKLLLSHFFNFLASPFLHLLHFAVHSVNKFGWIESVPLGVEFSLTLLWTSALLIALYGCHFSEARFRRFLLPIAVAAIPLPWLSAP
jgi:hypothetical protein